MDIFVRVLNPLLMLVMPLTLGVFLARRQGGEWRLFGIGAVTFVASQVLHIPFNAWILNPFLGRIAGTGIQAGNALIVSALFLGLSAGIFEETVRYLVFRFWLKDARDWRSALMLGAGHGGIEAIIVGVLAALTVIQIMTLRGVDLATVVPAEQLDLAKAQIATFWALPWYAVLLGALERASAMALHLGATVLVLQAFTRKHIGWLFVAILWHALLDAVAVYGIQTWGMYITEGAILLMALVSLIFVYVLKEIEQPQLDGFLSLAGLEETALPEITLSERLDESRYT